MRAALAIGASSGRMIRRSQADHPRRRQLRLLLQSRAAHWHCDQQRSLDAQSAHYQPDQPGFVRHAVAPLGTSPLDSVWVGSPSTQPDPGTIVYRLEPASRTTVGIVAQEELLPAGHIADTHTIQEPPFTCMV